jgi:hypothetical protein
MEAVRRGDKSTWQYAFGRATTYQVEACLGSSFVWTTATRNDPSQALWIRQRPMPD